MKKGFLTISAFAFSFLLSGVFTAPPVEAALGDQCGVDLAAQVPASQNWKDVYQIRDENGDLWQRAIISHVESGVLKVREGETTNLYLTGQPNKPMQFFLYSAEAEVQRPDITVCVDAGNGDQSGQVIFPIHSRVLWPLVDQKVIVDAWTLLTEDWQGKTEEETNQNFVIGTHMAPPDPLTVEIESTSTCGRPLCAGSEYSLASIILPDSYPDVARGVFPFPSGSANNTFASEVIITKLGPSTFYTMIDNGSADNAALKGTEQFVDRALTAEVIKRILLGAIGGATTGLDTLNREAFAEGVNATADSPAKQLLISIRDALAYGNGDAQRQEALNKLHQQIMDIFPKDIDNRFASPSVKLLSEIFPPARAGTKPEDNIDGRVWADQLEQVFLLWTEATVPNTCLIESNVAVANNFLSPPPTVSQQDTPPIACNEVNAEIELPAGSLPSLAGLFPPVDGATLPTPNPASNDGGGGQTPTGPGTLPSWPPTINPGNMNVSSPRGMD